MERWRRLGDLAGENGVVLSTETHEPFGHNGDIACRTMRELDHPNLRMNFDTANVYYYNHDIDGVTELKKELDYVASVHLKDTPGGYHDMNFPVFGQGIVDFSGVFKVLNAHGFSGPFTMELEGPLTADKTLEERVASVKACMDYLRSIGAC
jgi:inosose dehydratase